MAAARALAWRSDISSENRWTVGPTAARKPALNAFAITFGDRFPAAETY
jgi:hypothetical protein